MRVMIASAAFGLMLAVLLGAAVVALGGCAPVPGQSGPMVNIGTVTVTQSPTTSTTTTQTATANSGKPWPAPAIEREPVDRCKDCGS